MGASLVFVVSCAAEPGPVVSPEAKAPAVHTSIRTPETDGGAAETTPVLKRVEAIVAAAFEDTEDGSRWREQMQAHGLDAPLIAAALREVASRCPNTQRCGLTNSERETTELLIRGAQRIGTMEASLPLLQLDRVGYHAAGPALEQVLARQVAGDAAGGCEPPSADAVSSARSGLSDFVVFDRRADELVARTPTAAELDDLAYFYAAVAETGAPVGTSQDFASSRSVPTALARGQRGDEAAAARKDHLYELSDALETGNLAKAQGHAGAYLKSLGYPGPIDRSLEDDQSWGGPRFAYVMRDLALVSEVVGEVEIAADLYRRANPGGGTCGTSVDYRRGKQLRGLIRTEERAGRCQRVVAERLMDWDHDLREDDRPALERYGPARLREAGYDLARLYRGAMLTRNRDAERKDLDAALHSLPLAQARAARQRLDREGPEAWEFRVRATEGLADVQGEAAIDPLLETLRWGSDELRARTLEALGALGHRNYAGPCSEDDGIWLSGGSWSSVWSRRVEPVGTTCQTQLDDSAANALATSIARYIDAKSVHVASAALETTGKLASERSRAVLRKTMRRTAAGLRSHCDGVKAWSAPCQDATHLDEAARASWDRWASVVDRPASD